MDHAFYYNSDELGITNESEILYVVAFGRDHEMEEDYVSGPDDDAGAVRQLVGEIQEAFSEGHIAGFFNVVARKQRGGDWIYTEGMDLSDPKPEGPLFNVYVHGPDGKPMHHELTTSEAFDTDTNLLLTANDTMIFLAQIIDHGHDWGEHPDDCDDLRHLASHGVKAKTDFDFYVPDGWRVSVRIPMDQENPLPPETELPRIPMSMMAASELYGDPLMVADEDTDNRSFTLMFRAEKCAADVVPPMGWTGDVCYGMEDGTDIQIEATLVSVDAE